MKRNTIIILIVSFVLLALLMMMPGGKSKKELDWTPSYGLSDKKPLGLYVLNNEFNSLFQDRKISRSNLPPVEYLSEVLNESIDAPQTFICIDDNLTWNDASVYEVMNAIRGGMNGFISAHYFPAALVEELNLNSFYSEQDSGEVNVTVGKNQFPIKAKIELQHFTRILKIYSDSAKVLGGVKVKDSLLSANFVSVSLGKGKLFLHTCPAVFTNYYLLKADSKKYVEALLSEVPGKEIVWFTNEKGSGGISNAPLSFILSQEALRNAFFFILVGALLFFIFNAKRKQRILPIIPKLTNTSVEFTKTIGNLYFQEGSPMELLNMRSAYLLEKIRSEYNTQTDDLGPDMVSRLALKTGKNIEDVEELVAIQRSIRNRWIQDPKSTLTTFDNLINKIFY